MTAGWRPLDPYLALKFLHVAGAAILLGTGLGIAFFLFVADRAGNFEALATTLRHVVIADYVFTATPRSFSRSPGSPLSISVAFR